MKNSILAILAIIGSIVGSGFISGKEIVVFFSRFGVYSFPCIFLAFIILFVLIKLLLDYGPSSIERLNNSKIAFFINFAISLFFSAAMFAGIIKLLNFENKIISFLIFSFVLLLSFFVFRFGIGSLNKINLILVPFMLILFVGLLFSKFSLKSLQFSSSFGGVSFIYSILYVFLNTANGGVLISTMAKKLSVKQKTQVAFFSALTLSVVLLIANVVLLLNPTSFDCAMPLVSIFSGVRHLIMTIVVFVGCLTTLLTLVYSLSTSLRGLCKNEFFIYFASVILPLLLSLCGFNFIVEYLYPIASVLGIYLLCELSFIPLFKRKYKKKHSASKYT